MTVKHAMPVAESSGLVDEREAAAVKREAAAVKLEAAARGRSVRAHAKHPPHPAHADDSSKSSNKPDTRVAHIDEGVDDFHSMAAVTGAHGSAPLVRPRVLRAQPSMKSFIVLDDNERSSVKVGHIAEMPRVLLDIMSRHHTRVHELFITLDENNDGLIELSEFQCVLEGIGFEVPRPTDIAKLFDAIDTDNTRHITFEELEAFCRSVKRGKELLTPESEAERRKRLGLDEAEAAAAAAAAAEAARLQRELEAEAARLAALEEARRQRAREEAEMSAWLRRTQEENQKRYDAMLAAALALLPGGSANPLNSNSDDERKRGSWANRRPWKAHTGPRIERTASRRPMAFRAAPDPRPSSIACPTRSDILYVNPRANASISHDPHAVFTPLALNDYDGLCPAIIAEEC